MKTKNPRNILKYESKALTDMKASQIIFFVLGIVEFGSVGFLLHYLIPWTTSFIISGILSLPFLLSAFLKINELTFFQVMVRIIKIEFMKKGRRLYKSRGYKYE